MTTSLEERIKSLIYIVTTGGGAPYFIELRDKGASPLRLGPYENPANVEADADSLKGYFAALWEEATQVATAGCSGARKATRPEKAPRRRVAPASVRDIRPDAA